MEPSTSPLTVLSAAASGAARVGRKDATASTIYLLLAEGSPYPLI